MAVENAKLFKGLQFVKASTFSGTTPENNVLYFVRPDNPLDKKTDGYLQFNGKKYGTGEDAIAAVKAFYGELKIGEKHATIAEYVKSVLDAGAVTLEVQDSDKYLGVTSAKTETGGTVYTLASKAGAIEGAITSAVTEAKTVLVGNENTIDTIKYAEKLANDAAADVTAETARAEGIEAQLRRDVDAKVKSVEGTNTVVATTTEHAVRVSLKTSDKGNVKFTQDTDGLSANVTIPDATVTGVKADDKFLSLTDKLVEADVSIAYDADDKKIYLYGKDKTKANAVSSIDCKAFIKDGMLDGSALYTATAETGKVTINTHEYDLTGLIANHAYIVLVWNTDAQKQAMAIDVTSLIDTYTAKADGGLVLEDHAFSVDTTKIATVESVNGVTTRVTTLEGKVGSPAAGEVAATGLFKAVADEAQTARDAEKANADKIAILNGNDTVKGSVDKKIKDALEAGAVTLEVKGTDAYLGVTSAKTENGRTVYTLASKEAKIKEDIKTAADAVKVSVTNGTYVKGSVDEAGRTITLSEKIQAVASADASTAETKGLAEASDVKNYVDTKVRDKNVSAEGESGETALVTASATDNKVTVHATDKLKNAVAKAETSVQSVNGKNGAAVTLKATDIEVGAAVGQQAETATVNAVLADIYTKLGVAVKADRKTIKEAADHTLSVNLETKTDQTVAAGHIALEHGEDGALYGVMYCLGDDAE